jgi:hypothetical protein
MDVGGRINEVGRTWVKKMPKGGLTAVRLIVFGLMGGKGFTVFTSSALQRFSFGHLIISVPLDIASKECSLPDPDENPTQALTRPWLIKCMLLLS